LDELVFGCDCPAQTTWSDTASDSTLTTHTFDKRAATEE